MSASADGQVVAVPQGNYALVLHRNHPDRRVVLGPHYDVRFTAVSRDGRHVVTCTHWEDGRSSSAQIWDAESGKRVHDLALHGSTVATFSADGRWLITNTSGGGCRLWEAGTWREVRRFNDAGFALSPDSRLLALADVVSVIRLVETATGREVARLTGPEPLWYQPACFTPDGTRLISTGPDASSLYVWDLRLIRRQLKELGLDWDWPQFAEPDASQKAKPKNVEILPGELGQALRAVERIFNKIKSERNNEALP
jgi:WD40 repeat protein